MPDPLPAKGENERVTAYWTRVICFQAWAQGNAAGQHNARLASGADGDPDDEIIRNPYRHPETS